MINKEPLDAIEKMVDIIYSPDQDGLDSAFVQILDSILGFIENMAKEGYLVDMTEELKLLQDAYLKKDYLELADALLYDIKPEIENLFIK